MGDGAHFTSFTNKIHCYIKTLGGKIANIPMFLISDIDGRVGKLDNLAKVIVFMSGPHHEIHGGHRFFYSELITLGAAAVRDILLVTPNTTEWAHFTELTISGNKETNVKVYRGTTTSDDGTVLTVQNRNQNSANTNSTIITHTPTITDLGTLIFESQFGESTGPATSRAGGGSGTRDEVILKQDEKYLIRETSAAADNDISNFLDWYEHTNE